MCTLLYILCIHSRVSYLESQYETDIVKLNMTKSQVAFGLVAVSLLTALAGWFSFWTESEMWSTVVVKNLFSDSRTYDFTVKPLFNLLLFGNFRLAEILSVHPMETARALFALNGLLALFLLHGIVRRLGHSHTVAAFVCLFCVGNSFFIKRFFSVRSDMITTTLFLSLTLLALGPKWKRLKMRGRYGVFLLVTIAALCFTPKSAFNAVCWALAFLFPADKLKSRKIQFGGILISGAAVLILIINPAAFRFFLESFRQSSSGLAYWDIQRWEHSTRFFMENPLMLLCGLSTFYCLLSRQMKFDFTDRAVLKFSALNWIFMMTFPERLPFFIGSLVPFFALAMPVMYTQMAQRFKVKPNQLTRIALATMALSLLSVVYWSAFLLKAHNNLGQRAFISWFAGKSEELKPLKIYDPAGVMPFNPNAENWFVGPGESGNADTLKVIVHKKPDVILVTNKLQFLGDEFSDLLDTYYWSSGDGVYMRALHILPEKWTASAIKADLEKAMPFLVDNPDHRIVLRPQALQGLDMTRYGKWNLKDKTIVKFDPQVSMTDLAKLDDAVLYIPRSANLIAMPVLLEVPFGPNWISMFRFDPEF